MNLRFLISAVLLLLLLIASCSNSNHKIIYIADTKVDCEGVAPQKCLQIKTDENASDWSYFYDDIEGFDYEDGYFYKLKVEIINVKDAPADSSSKYYKLIEVLEQSWAPMSLDKSSWFVTHLKDIDNFSRNPFIKIDPAENTISGNTSCNRFSAKIQLTENRVEISEVSTSDLSCKDAHVEYAFLEALPHIAFYSLTNDKLLFLDKNRTLLMECNYLKHE